jgi:hypothetical protein
MKRHDAISGACVECKKSAIMRLVMLLTSKMRKSLEAFVNINVKTVSLAAMSGDLLVG